MWYLILAPLPDPVYGLLDENTSRFEKAASDALSFREYHLETVRKVSKALLA
jgi:hypothetical protein